MTTKLNPYLSFKDNARQAMEFYHTVFGGKLDIRTFKEFQASQDPSEDDRVMHAQIDTDNGMTIMASDTPDRMEFKPAGGFSISLSGENERELRGYWDKLVKGGTVTMPLEKAPWGDTFGMCVDQFGVSWLVNVNSGERSEAQYAPDSRTAAAR